MRWPTPILWLALCRFLSAAEVEAPSPGASADIEAKLTEARSLHLSNSTRSRALAEEALALARARGDRRSEAVALVEHAIALRRQNHNGEAVQDTRQALEIIETLDSRPLLRRALKEAGQTFWAFGDAPNATDYFQRSLKLCEEDRDIGGQSDAEAGLGAVADDLHDSLRSRGHKERALALAEKAGDIGRVALYSVNLGHALLEAKDYAAARKLYTRAQSVFEELGERTNVADARADLARVDEAEGKLDVAERTLRELLPSRRRLRGHVKVTATLVQLASVLRKEDRAAEALPYLEEAWNYAKDLSSPSKILVLDALAATHEALGEYQKALADLRLRHEAAEKQRGEVAQARAAEVREVFSAERREAEIARLRSAEVVKANELRARESDLRARQAELDRARWQRYGLVAVLVFGLITFSALLSRHRLKAAADQRVLAEARAAQRAAEEADRVKTRFLGIASHDIRSPLGNIVNLTGQLRSEKSNDENHVEHCDMIGSEAQRVICLVEDLITTAALEAGKLELRTGPMDLTETTRAALQTLRWQADAKRQKIEFPEPEPGAGHLIGDAARLNQVIANLVGNAIKFSPPGETIRMTLERVGGNVVLAIRDRGAGIAPHDIPRLFKPFERLTNHPTVGETSHGLGLSIAHEIVRHHGGEIRVESQPGEGSTFAVILPG